MSGFDRDYWESHWRRAQGSGEAAEVAANPYLSRELGGLRPGTALDAGCGEGAEALWLAAAGWRVTGADISTEALTRAAARERASPAAHPVRWVVADLTVWEPDQRFDLVATHYAHPAMPQLAFYARVSRWVAPGGTLLVVGHRHSDGKGGHAPGAAGHGHATDRAHDSHEGAPPPEATTTAAAVETLLDPAEWDVVTAVEEARTATDGEGRPVELRDLVVRAVRRA